MGYPDAAREGTPVIRPVSSEDRHAIYDICLRTADAGGDATSLYTDPALPGHVWAGPYLAFEPAHGFVVDRGDGPIGYALGALDSRAFEATLEREWWPALRARYPLDASEMSPADLATCALIHDPPRADAAIVIEYPSHLHVDLLPVAQGRGEGRRIVEHLVEALQAAGSVGVHLGVDSRNVRALGFYRALGFDELSAAPGHVALGRRLASPTPGRLLPTSH